MNENKESASATLYVRPFVSILAEVTDFRQQPQYPLPTLLSVILLGLLCGQNTIRRIAAWAQRMPLSLRRRLGLPHARVPGRSTLQHTLANLNVDDLPHAWQTWVEEARAIWPHPESQPELAIAVDGKVLRGSADPVTDTSALTVLGTMVQQLGVALTHQPIAAGTNETSTLPSLLEQLAPRAWVALRDMVIGLLRFWGACSIAQARALLAFSPEHAASIIGIPLD